MTLLDPDHLLALRHLARRRDGARSATALPGGLVIRARGRGLETAEIRAFADGDDPRHIDRNATARTGRAQVRSFHAERDRTTLLIADFRPSMLWGTRRTLRSIAAAEALCLAGWHAARTGSRVAAIATTAGGTFFAGARGGDRGMVAAIGTLAEAHAAAEQAALAAAGAQETDPPLAPLLEQAARLVPRGAEAVLASALDAPGEGFEAAAQALARRCPMHLLRVTDAFERTAPSGAYRFRSRGGSATARIGRRGLDAVRDGDSRLRAIGLQVTVLDATLAPGAQVPDG